MVLSRRTVIELSGQQAWPSDVLLLWFGPVVWCEGVGPNGPPFLALAPPSPACFERVRQDNHVQAEDKNEVNTNREQRFQHWTLVEPRTTPRRTPRSYWIHRQLVGNTGLTAILASPMRGPGFGYHRRGSTASATYDGPCEQSLRIART